jgi:hypothetical protein
MMPSTPTPESGSGGSSPLRRWGPIAAIVAVVAIVAGFLVLGGGDDDDDSDEAVTGGASTTTGEEEAATPNGAISFSQAEEQGLDVTFNEACDLETGRVAIPYFFAPECYANAEPSADWQPSRGVTADSVNVVVYVAPETDPILDYITAAINNDDTNPQEQETMEGFVAMFQATYQTYGRTVNLIFMEGSGTSEDQVAARADAVRADEEFDAFAVFGGPALANAWTEEINARDVICVGCPPVTEPEPNVFGILASSEQNRLHIVEYVSTRLAGEPAEFAGDEAMRTQERVFGHLFIEANDESATSAADLRSRLEAEGITLAEQASYILDPNTLQEQANGIIGRFRDAGVTSVIVQTDPIAPSVFTQVATLQQWFPEWILTGSTLTDTTAFGRTYDQQQWAHAFGISQLGARTAPGVGGSSQLYEWFNGAPPPADDSDGVIYPAPAIFFAGLQLAGPDLDVEAMRTGLLSLAPSDTRTITQPGFSYGDHGLYPNIDYAGIDDFTEVWWDPTVAGDDEIDRPGSGMYRYVDGGRRYRLGEYGEESTPLFVLDGTITVYDEPPPSEQVTDYPPPG